MAGWSLLALVLLSRDWFWPSASADGLVGPVAIVWSCVVVVWWHLEEGERQVVSITAIAVCKERSGRERSIFAAAVFGGRYEVGSWRRGRRSRCVKSGGEDAGVVQRDRPAFYLYECRRLDGVPRAPRALVSN